MAESTNPYVILGVSKGISDKELKVSYVNLVKKYDPEKHTERFMTIQAAYDKLKNPSQRAKEDILTFNSPKGDYLFNSDERCVNNQGPTEAELAKARADFRENPAGDEPRGLLLRLLSQHAHHHVVRKMLMEAIRDWEEVLDIDPAHIRARHNLHLGSCALAQSYALHGLHDEAIELWERALKINPDDTDVVHNLAIICEKAKIVVKAGQYWNETITRLKSQMVKDRENDYLRQLVVEALQHHGEFLEANPHAAPPKPAPPKPAPPKPAPPKPAPTAAPSSSLKPAGASPASTSAQPKPATAPAPAPATASGSGTAPSGASSSGIRKPVIPAQPQAAPPSEPAPAAPASGLDRYREIAKLKPNDFDAQYQLCNKLMESQLYEEALSELGKLSRQHPKNTEVLNIMGWAYLYSGQKDEGFNCWKKSMAIDPKNTDTRDQLVRAHLSLGRTFRQKGMFTQSLVHFKQLLTLMPNSVEVHMEIAATYDMKGDVRSAANEYARVLTIDPKHKDARKAMNDLRMKR